MCEGVTEGDAWGSGLNEFVGVLGLKHAGLGGHVGEAFYTEAGDGAWGKERICHADQVGVNAVKEARRKRSGEGKRFRAEAEKRRRGGYKKRKTAGQTSRYKRQKERTAG